MFSRRASVDTTPNRLSIALGRARAQGLPLLDLTESNPTRADIPYDEDGVLAPLSDSRSLRYEPAPSGSLPAREAIAGDLESYGLSVDPGRIVLTSSTSEAYAFLFKLLADPGDELLVPAPSYPLFEYLARLESVRAVPYRLAYDGAWTIDIDSVRAHVSRRSRAILVVHPNNPTGSYVKRDEFGALASLGLPLISDEVFARYPLRDDASRAMSALESAGAPLVFALGGLSKLALLPQMKVAWIAVSGEAMRVGPALEHLEIIGDTFLSVGTPAQNALARWLGCRAVAEGAVVDRTRRNLDAVRAAAQGTAISVLDVEGGWYVTLRLPRTQPEEDWALDLLERDRVIIHPGHFFDFENEAYLVVSLLTRETTFQEGIRRIVERVADA
jgi:aspartate/methionine/tyrosine aminotransferase